MDEASDKIELTPKQNKRLLHMAVSSHVSEAGNDPVEDKANTLFDILVSPLPVDKLVLDSLPAVVRGLCRKLRSVAGQAIGDLLQNPQTDIATLTAIKDYTKQSGTCSRSDAEGDAFLAIYYGSIASALVFHNEKISQHSYKDLEQFFKAFAEKTWVPDELTGLFGKAADYCHSKKGKDNPQEE